MLDHAPLEATSGFQECHEQSPNHSHQVRCNPLIPRKDSPQQGDAADDGEAVRIADTSLNKIATEKQRLVFGHHRLGIDGTLTGDGNVIHRSVHKAAISDVDLKPKSLALIITNDGGRNAQLHTC